MRKVTEVAVGVLLDGCGRFLMASRPDGKPYAGWWEFPGGKLEAGETVLETLAREYVEELGVSVRKAAPWFVFEREYPHAYVRLHFCRITDWEGVLQAREGQCFRWFESLEQAQREKLLPMCSLVIERLMLPARVALVRNPDSTTLFKDFESSRAQGILTKSPNKCEQELAQEFGVPLIVCRQWFETALQAEDSLLQETLVGALTPQADAYAILRAARQRTPLYAAACGDSKIEADLMRLGAQGVYVEI